MLRQVGAAVAALAVLYGLSAAPYTHAHHAIDSVADEHHPQGATLVHTHASPHSHQDPGDHDSVPPNTDEPEEQIWSVDGFVFKQAASGQPSLPAFLVAGVPHVPLTSTWMGADLLQPPAHGPPAGSTPGLRAPPVFPPAVI